MPQRRFRRRAGTALSIVANGNLHRASVAIVLGLIGVGATLAQFSSATSLHASGGSLGAGTSVISNCDNDGIATSFGTVFDSTTSSYVVTSVRLSGIAIACNQKQLQLVLTNAEGVSVGSALVPTLSIPANNTPIAIPMNAVAAEPIRGMAIVISG